MTRLGLLAICLGLPIATAALAQGDAKKIYEADTKKVLAGDLSFDWKEYRFAAARGGAAYLDWHPIRTQFMKQMDAGDTDAALKSAQVIIDHNMAEPEGHLLALIVDQKLGRNEDAAFQHNVIKAYLDSILSSGDGKSSKTAFVVATVDEEYFYLNLVMGIGLPLQQSLSHMDGHSYDVLKVKDRDGSEQELWFNVDEPMNRMSEAIGGSHKK
jgi:hypothetical protein